MRSRLLIGLFVALAAVAAAHARQDGSAVLANVVRADSTMPFLCDSVRARDCFEMFSRHYHDDTRSLTQIARTRHAIGERRLRGSRIARVACLSNVGSRGDRCDVIGRSR